MTPTGYRSLELGKLAHLMILDKNPLVDIHNPNTIHGVMKNGVWYEGDTLNQLWPEQKKLEALWFWEFAKPKAGEPLQYGATNKP